MNLSVILILGTIAFHNAVADMMKEGNSDLLKSINSVDSTKDASGSIADESGISGSGVLEKPEKVTGNYEITTEDSVTGLNLPTRMIDPTKVANMEELGTTENYIKSSRTTQSTKGTKEEGTGTGTETGTTGKKEEKKTYEGGKKSKTGEKGSLGQTSDSLKNNHELAKVITDTTNFSWYIKKCFPKYAGELLLI